jgi:hypothetical protein
MPYHPSDLLLDLQLILKHCRLTLMGVFHMSELNMLLLEPAASGSFTFGASVGAAAGAGASSAAGLLKLKPPHLGALGACRGVWGGGVC